MHLDISLVAPRQGPVDAELDVPAGTALHQVHDALVALLDRPVPAGVRWWVDGGPVEPGALLGDPPLVRGALFEARGTGVGGTDVGGAAGGEVAGGAPVAVTVACGPGAGAAARLPLGVHVLGRDPGAAVVLPDPDVSRAHAQLEVGAEGVRVRDLGSTNGTRVGGEPVGAAWREVPAGAAVELGRTVLRCGPAPSAPTPARGRGDGSVGVHRSPRPHRAGVPLTLDLPPLPQPPVPARISVLAVVLPLALSVVMALVWSPMALLFGLATPVLVVGTALGERRAQRRQHAAALAAREQACATLREAAGAAVAADRAALEALGPELGSLAAAVRCRGPLLWERSAPDLLLRLGRGRVASSVVVREPEAVGLPADRSAEQHEQAPVLVPLRRLGVLGIAGPRAAREGLARSLVLQAAVLHRPADLRLVVLEAPEPAPGPVPGTAPEPAAGPAPARASWRWVRWLPHHGDDRVLPAEVSQRAATVVAEVQRRAALRSAAASTAPGPPAPEDPVLLVVLDGAGRLRRAPGIAEVLAQGPAVGVVALCLEERPGDLPVECASVARLAGVAGDELHLTGTAPPRTDPQGGAPRAEGPWAAERWAPAADGAPVAADLVPLRVADQVARWLAPLVEATPARGASALPHEVRLLDVLDVDATDAAAVAAGWRRRPRCTRVVLGRSAEGAWEVDLAADGPHALVAGTTGSGKSELLTTLVLSLATGNRPEELAVVLVDYKGGAAFAGLAGLPHVVGLVTDLDVHLTRRALASLQAEVRRRERVLRDLGCRDHAEHVALRDASADGTVEPLPRLVVVVDEFRVLAEELPDFLGGLVRLAAVGRSLGVHLVLATQRPAGVVSADIRANTALRIALRVQDDADSLDVVDGRDAARLPAGVPGRAVTRSGNGPLVIRQAARASGTTPAARAGSGPTVRRRRGPAVGAAPRGASAQDAAAQGGGAAAQGGAAAHGGAAVPDDLTRIVAALRRAAEGAPAPRSPWLPPLPDAVTLEHLAEVCDAEAAPPAAAPAGATPAPPPALVVGVRDEPRHQRRRPLVWDLASGPLLVVGAPRSGRTSTLRAVLGAVAHRSPAEVQAHVVAGPSRLLVGTEALPQVGSVVDVADGERLLRLLHRLTAVVRARRTDAARPSGPHGPEGQDAPDGPDGPSRRDGRGGLGSAASGRPAAAPTVLLLVDGADRLLAQAAATPSAPGDDVGELLVGLLTDGPAVGVLTALAGDRSLLLGRCGALVRQRLLHALSDPADAVLAGVPPRQVPSRMPAGRVLVLGEEAGPGGEVVEAQVAVLGGPGADDAQRLTALAREAEQRWRDVSSRPWCVPALPQRVELTDLGPRVPVPAPRPERGAPGRWPARGDRPGPVGLVVGVGAGADRVQPAVLDLAVSTSWLVAGPPGSGRSSALVTVGRSARSEGAAVLALATAGSPLATWARAQGVAVPDGRDEAAVATALTGLSGPRCEAGALAVVLVDDVERLAGTATEDVLLRHLLAPPGSALPGGPGSGPPPGSPVLVAAGTTSDLVTAYRGLGAQLRRARCGLLLHPSGPGDGELLGTALPRSSPGPAGRATLVTGGRPCTVQLASPWSPHAGDPVERDGQGAGAQHQSPGR